MANLIITIISIILIAITVLFGIYYGGDVLSNNQARTAAVRLQEEAQQLQASALLYMSDTGHDFVRDIWYSGTALLPDNGVALQQQLIPQYLSQPFTPLPILDDPGKEYSNTYWNVNQDTISFAATQSTAPYFLIRYYVGGITVTIPSDMKYITNVCKAAVKIAHGDETKFIQRDDGLYNSQPISQVPGINANFDCLVQYTNTTGLLTSLDQCADPNAGCRLVFIAKFY